MTTNIIKMTFAFFSMCLIISCDDEVNLIQQEVEEVSVQFNSVSLTVNESAEEQDILISFDKPVSTSGILSLSISNTEPSRFTMEPAITDGRISLSVLPNQESALIKIRPINNSMEDEDYEFTITISATSQYFITGENKTVAVKLSDDDASVPEHKPIANLIQIDKNISEANALGKTFSIKLSEKLEIPGTIEVLAESPKAIYGTHFITEPEATNGSIILTPAIGSEEVLLTVIPIDNSIITGDLKILFTIMGTTGSIRKGDELTHALIVQDDELAGKPKGYEVSGGQWGLKKTYEYDELGRVQYVHIEKFSPATSFYTETYHYNADGTLQKINTYPLKDIQFTWTNGRITKSESIDNGVLKEYVEYEYDEHGNISGTANFFRQPDGQFKLSFINVYLYYADGNLYKSQTYIPSEAPGEYSLVSTSTFEAYINETNPFPMVEIIPTVKTQSKLPTMYSVEANGVTLEYTITYEFQSDGKVSKRIARVGNLSETSNYLYY